MTIFDQISPFFFLFFFILLSYTLCESSLSWLLFSILPHQQDYAHFLKPNSEVINLVRVCSGLHGDPASGGGRDQARQFSRRWVSALTKSPTKWPETHLLCGAYLSNGFPPCDPISGPPKITSQNLSNRRVTSHDPLI